MYKYNIYIIYLQYFLLNYECKAYKNSHKITTSNICNKYLCNILKNEKTDKLSNVILVQFEMRKTNTFGVGFTVNVIYTYKLAQTNYKNFNYTETDIIFFNSNKSCLEIISLLLVISLSTKLSSELKKAFSYTFL